MDQIDEELEKIKHPDKYPIDQHLIDEAESIVNGMDVHDRNQAIGTYKSAVYLYNETKTWSYYISAWKWERILRGIVVEARLGRVATIQGYKRLKNI
jgi:hypothetical protein